MARKIFISILGTTCYKKTKYYFENDKQTAIETYFIQEAAIKHLCKDWSEKDKAIIFTTDLAYDNNWEHPAQQKNERCENYDGLSKLLLEDLNPIFDVSSKWIPDGKTEDEIWDIFNIIYNEINEGDELYVDITHSFRSLPMLLTVLLNYAKALKDISVKSITYGNWEARDDENYSPVIDLTALSVLQDWTIAGHDFQKYGNVNKLVSLTNETIRPILVKSKGADTTARTFNNLSKSLKNFTQNIQTVRCEEIMKGENLKKIKENLKEIRKGTIPQIEPILEKITTKLNYFSDEEDVRNTLSAAKWSIDNGLYQQAYSFMVEGVISYILLKNNLDIYDVETRMLLTSGMKIYLEKLPEENWNEFAKENEEQLKKFISYFGQNRELIKELSSITEFRNDFMHCGMRNNRKKSGRLIDKITNSYSKFIALIH